MIGIVLDLGLGI